MHPNVSINIDAAILRVKDALERRTPVATQIVRLPARIDVLHHNFIKTCLYNGSSIVVDVKAPE